MKVSRSEFRKEVVPDTSPDASYLEQEGFEERLAEYRSDRFSFVGVYAAVTLRIPFGTDGTRILQEIRTPGLWGIEDDSSPEYLEEVFQEECATLRTMLEAMGMEVTE